MPEVSILMSSYNHELYVGTAIESVLAQTYTDWELIVSDDCSTDGTWDVVSAYDDPRISVSRMPHNTRACGSYNEAMARASGRILMTLDSDDAYHPEKLARQVEYLGRHPEVAVLGTHITTAPHAPDVERWFNDDVDVNDPAQWVWSNRLAHSSVAVRREVYDDLGGLREDLVRTPDWELWLRALAAGYTIDVLAEPLTQIRVSPDGVTHGDPAGTMAEYLGICEEYWQEYLERDSSGQAAQANLRAAMTHYAQLPDDQLGRVRAQLASFLAGSPDSLAQAITVIREQSTSIAEKDRIIAEQARVLDERAQHLEEAAQTLQERHEQIAGMSSDLIRLALIEASPKQALLALGRSLPKAADRRLRRDRGDGSEPSA